MPEPRKLNVFLSYASPDVDIVRELYQRLAAESWISPWFDRECLLPGMDWKLEIDKSMRSADAIVICLSTKSVTREGYVQKELRRALDYADEKPEGAIFVIPLRLDNCEVPQQLKKWQWVDYFVVGAHKKLLKSLYLRATGLGVVINSPKKLIPAPTSMQVKSQTPDVDLDLYQFIKINSPAIKYPFWIGKYPVTNAQYDRFLKADDFSNPDYWMQFPKYDENCQLIGDWGDVGWLWLKDKLKDYEYFPPKMWKVEPEYWRDENFGIAQLDNPVVGVTWYEVNAYCKWLSTHWRELSEGVSLAPSSNLNSSFSSAIKIQTSPTLTFRLPLETEWVAAAGGNKPDGRYPWDLPGRATEAEQEIIKLANVGGSIGCTTLVKKYFAGVSPFGVMDMAGNVWEWQENFQRQERGWLGLRGGSWIYPLDGARVSFRGGNGPHFRNYFTGFRVVALPS